MTKEELSNYIWLKHEIKSQKERLQRAEGKTQPSREADLDLPIAGITLKEEIKESIKNAEARAIEIEQFIQSIEQEKLREILRSRFIDGLDWKKVGEVNYIDPDHARRIVRRFFEEEARRKK